MLPRRLRANVRATLHSLFNSHVDTPANAPESPFFSNEPWSGEGDAHGDDTAGHTGGEGTIDPYTKREWGSVSKQRAYSMPRARSVSVQPPLLVAFIAVTVAATAFLSFRSHGSAVELPVFDIPVEKGYAQRVGNWSASEMELRTYKGWGNHTPHESLERMLDGLSESSGGTPIGLSASDPPEPMRPRRAHGGTGPGVYRGGSPEKYGKLVREFHVGRRTTACESDDWGDEIEAHVAGQIVNGSVAPQIVEFVCRRSGECGGVADRVPFDLVFDSPHIDWSTSYHDEVSYNQKPFYRDPRLGTAPYLADSYNRYVPETDRIHDAIVATKWHNNNWVEYWGNRGTVLRFFQTPSSAEPLYKLGMTPDSAYSCLIDYLIRPKMDVINFISQYMAFFELPSIYTISIQIRTGDASMHKPEVEEANTVEKYKHYFKCAEQVAKSRARKDQKVVYYLLSDSNHLKADALAKFPDRVVTTGLGASHPLEDDGVKKETFAVAHSLQDAIADSWVQESADVMIITDRSGFGKLQSFRRGGEGTTITLPRDTDYWSKDDPTNWIDINNIDCSRPEMYTTWTKLSNAWSYG
ncbi:putative glycosyltransferase [Pseudohyphozyma bogoriensis]|nr:putative glycosyltransferase [Pseudohyphozyma bogoriensis]